MRNPGHLESKTSSPNSDSLFVKNDERLFAQSKSPTVSSALTRPPPVARRAPLEQSSSDSESSSAGETSADSLMESTKTQKKKQQNHKSTGLGNSILQPKSPGHVSHSSNQTIKQASGTVVAAKTRDSKDAHTAPKAILQRSANVHESSDQRSGGIHPAASTVSGVTSLSLNAAAHVSANPRQIAPTVSPTVKKSSNPNTAIRSANKIVMRTVRKPTTGTQGPAPIKFVDQPKAQRTEWKSDKHYSTLKFRHNAAKRSQIEKAPDVSSLDFVNSPPTGVTKSRPPTREDNPYGRRDTTNRRVQEDTHVDTPRNDMSRPGSGTTAEPLAHWEVDKVPVVCPEWRLSNNCEFGAQKCRYMHRDQDPFGKDYPIGDIFGFIEPKHRNPPATCMFWYEGKCSKPADICKYAHRYTGFTIRDQKVVAIEPNEKAKPGTMTCWFWKNTQCRNAPGTCLYCHYDTGVMAKNPKNQRQKNGTSVNEIGTQPRIPAYASQDTYGKLPD
jgi:chromo domain-containing protein 1